MIRILLAASLVLAAPALAQLGPPFPNATGNDSTNGSDNGTGNATVPPPLPEEPVEPGSPFPVGLAVLVVGAAVVVGVLVYAASRR